MSESPYNVEDVILLEMAYVRLSAIKKAVEELGLNHDNFKSNYTAYTSAAMSIMLAANAIRQVSMKFMKKHSHIPWRDFVLMANIVKDEVYDLELDALCNFVMNDFEKFYNELEIIKDTEMAAACQKYLGEYAGADEEMDEKCQQLIDKGLRHKVQ